MNVIFALYLISTLNSTQSLQAVYGTEQECLDEMTRQLAAQPKISLQCVPDTTKLLNPQYREVHKVKPLTK